MNYIRKVFLDASALLAWILYPDKPEPGGERLTEYLCRPERQRYSNGSCLTEVFVRLKWMRYHGEITDSGYFMRAYLLHTKIRNNTLKISEFNYWSNNFSNLALELVKKYENKIDYLDAVQIVDVLEGPYKDFAGPSRTLLITNDKKLRDGARAEGVEVWFPAEEVEPD